MGKFKIVFIIRRLLKKNNVFSERKNSGLPHQTTNVHEFIKTAIFDLNICIAIAAFETELYGNKTREQFSLLNRLVYPVLFFSFDINIFLFVSHCISSSFRFLRRKPLHWHIHAWRDYRGHRLFCKHNGQTTNNEHAERSSYPGMREMNGNGSSRHFTNLYNSQLIGRHLERRYCVRYGSKQADS